MSISEPGAKKKKFGSVEHGFKKNPYHGTKNQKLKQQI